MKTCVALLAFVAVGFAQNPAKPERPSMKLADPRLKIEGHAEEWIRTGEEREIPKYPWNGILIIHWLVAPNGNTHTYQIGGVPGYHSKERVEAFLDAFYTKEALAKMGPTVPNVVMCATDWGTGRDLREKLKELSKSYEFSVFVVGGAYRTAKLMEEPEPRKSAIERAFAASAETAAAPKSPADARPTR